MGSAQLASETAAVSTGSQPDSSGPAEDSSQELDACPSRQVLGMRVDATSYRETAEAITIMALAGHGGTVCVSNVHMVMEAFDDPTYARIVNAADRITPDGVPLVWALRLLGIADAQRVYGPSLLPWVCELASERQIPVGFYGGAPAVLDALVGRLTQRLPKLQAAFSYAPPFRPLQPDEDTAVAEAIESSGTRILFVGLGCPKQERWMADHRESLSCVMVGVGAAFDFNAGSKAQAPHWLQNAGLEWLFRMCCEPKRLWRRYLFNNPRFLFHFALQLARQRGICEQIEARARSEQ